MNQDSIYTNNMLNKEENKGHKQCTEDGCSSIVTCRVLSRYLDGWPGETSDHDWLYFCRQHLNSILWNLGIHQDKIQYLKEEEQGVKAKE